MRDSYIFIVDDSPSGNSRYPKRNVPRKRYMEIEAPDDDEYICKYQIHM